MERASGYSGLIQLADFLFGEQARPTTEEATRAFHAPCSLLHAFCRPIHRRGSIPARWIFALPFADLAA